MRLTRISDNNQARPTVAVVGLGKVGLPLAVHYTRSGHAVVGCDIDPNVVATVNDGRSHVTGEAGLEEGVRLAVGSRRLRATTDISEAVRESRVVVIIVPLAVGPQGRIDFTAVDAATGGVAGGLRPGTLVIYETTLPVGTTSGRLRRLLEEGSGLRCSADFFLAFSPERVYAGRIFEDLKRYPKVVGGVDAESGDRAEAFYRGALAAQVLRVSNADTAEFAKLAETSYRDVNIALANQLALYARTRNVDTIDAFNAANTQPFSHLHTPGIGVGGHCIPVYPQFVIADADSDGVEMLRLARKTNDDMVKVAINILTESLDSIKGKNVLVLGLAYREDVKELAFSVALRLIPALQQAGARVIAHDPLFEPSELDHLGIKLVEDIRRPPPVEAVIIQAYHRQYRELDWSRFSGLRVVLDGRGALKPEQLAGVSARYASVTSQLTKPAQKALRTRGKSDGDDLPAAR